MKKVTIAQLLTMGVIGFISLNIVGVKSAFSSTESVACCTRANGAKLLDKNKSPQFIWPSQGFISQGFHTFHEGIDISGAFGIPIVAAGDGEVIFAGQNDWGLGLAIQIRHSNGTVTVYGHTQRLLVRKGQQVSQGQLIAEMGSTGNSNGPHLHFEVHPNGQVLSGAVNPMPFLPPLVAGKIPPLRSVAVAPSKPKPVVPEPVVTPAPVASGSVRAEGGCKNEAVIAGETANFRVNVCRENGQLFYFGQAKQNPRQFVWLPARDTGGGTYRADNGKNSYYVSPYRVDVWQSGRKIRSERLYTQCPAVTDENPALCF
ncbi:MAG TPA: M23 family metallopeptidase [Coleofasciculaceae cyanobacterium]